MTPFRGTLLLALLLAGCKSTAPTPPPQQQQPQLTDPFRLEDGSRISSIKQWPARRAEIQRLLEGEQYGVMPSAPDKLTARIVDEQKILDGYATRRRVRLTMGELSFDLGLTLPTEAGPYPAIVHIDHRPELYTCSIPREVVARGFILAEFTPTSLCPDRPNARGPAQRAFPAATWGSIACWAWGASRALDHLLTLPQVDPKKVAVTGHSRSGKAALWAGAADRRFVLTAPQGSGCGGAGSYRIRGHGAERLADMARSFPHWFRPGLNQYAGKEHSMPHDQHLVFALVAPRALLSIDALGDAWANPYGTGATHLGARPVYRFLGAPDRIGIALRPGKHELSGADWRTLLDYADRIFGRPPQPGSAGRDFSKLAREVAPAPFRWRAPGEK